MVTGVRIAHLLTLFGLCVAGSYLPGLDGWTTALIGVAAGVVLATADVVVSRRSRRRRRPVAAVRPRPTDA